MSISIVSFLSKQLHTSTWSRFTLFVSCLLLTLKVETNRTMTSLFEIICLLIAYSLLLPILCLQRVQSFNNYLLLLSQQRGFQRRGAFTPDSSALPLWHRLLQSALITTSVLLGRLIDFLRSYSPLSGLYIRK